MHFLAYSAESKELFGKADTLLCSEVSVYSHMHENLQGGIGKRQVFVRSRVVWNIEESFVAIAVFLEREFPNER